MKKSRPNGCDSGKEEKTDVNNNNMGKQNERLIFFKTESRSGVCVCVRG